MSAYPWTELIAAVQTSLDELIDHPLYLGDDATAEAIENEGGDAAVITTIAHRLNAALAAVTKGPTT